MSALYLRSRKGDAGGWYRAARGRGEGRIRAGGVSNDVKFTPAADEQINDAVDSGYRQKYARYPSYVAPMGAQQARVTTLRLSPREGAR